MSVGSVGIEKNLKTLDVVGSACCLALFPVANLKRFGFSAETTENLLVDTLPIIAVAAAQPSLGVPASIVLTHLLIKTRYTQHPINFLEYEHDVYRISFFGS